MTWNRVGTTTTYVPTASTSPDDLLAPSQRAERSANLIEVCATKGGYWKAVCECGDAPELFAEERPAWQWITGHRCPGARLVLP